MYSVGQLWVNLKLQSRWSLGIFSFQSSSTPSQRKKLKPAVSATNVQSAHSANKWEKQKVFSSYLLHLSSQPIFFKGGESSVILIVPKQKDEKPSKRRGLPQEMMFHMSRSKGFQLLFKQSLEKEKKNKTFSTKETASISYLPDCWGPAHSVSCPSMPQRCRLWRALGSKATCQETWAQSGQKLDSDGTSFPLDVHFNNFLPSMALEPH